MSNYCQIVTKCELDSDWSAWFEGLTLTHNDRGETIISGQLRDQAAFYGLIAKVRDMCPFLISVKYMVNESLEDNDDINNNS
jgi:hypothetical protein